MPTQRAERRIVTCLFADIVGSTDLTVSLGPERMQRNGQEEPDCPVTLL